ncbi:MAG: transporter substrate-binding domain-containing protein [Alphaproteobacteria bacterium]|nr:transporter substrate-binding domain-containing protein [Alphaproteobacteria bacterium]
MKILRGIAVWAVASLAICGGQAQAACSHALTIGVIDWPPYAIWTNDNSASGLDIELMAAVFGEAGCTFQIMKMPFKRALRDVGDGRIDGVPSVSYTNERAAFGMYSAPVRKEVIGVFVRSGMPAGNRPKSFEELIKSNHRIGIVLGGWYGAAFDKAMKTEPGFRKRIQSIEDFETLFRSLQAGLVDVAINDVAGGRYVAERTMGSGTVQLLPFAVHVNDVHFLFSRKSVKQADIDSINQAIVALEKFGTISRITERYLPIALLDKLADMQ